MLQKRFSRNLLFESLIYLIRASCKLNSFSLVLHLYNHFNLEPQILGDVFRVILTIDPMNDKAVIPQ